MKSLNLEILEDFEGETSSNRNYPSFRPKDKQKHNSPILQVEDFTASPSFTPSQVAIPGSSIDDPVEALINIMPAAEIDSKPLDDFVAVMQDASQNSQIPLSIQALQDELQEVKIRLQDAEELNQKLIQILASQSSEFRQNMSLTNDEKQFDMELNILELIEMSNSVELDQENYKNHNEQLTEEIRAITEDFILLSKENKEYKTALRDQTTLPEDIQNYEMENIQSLFYRIFGMKLAADAEDDAIIEMLQSFSNDQISLKSQIDHLSAENSRLKSEINRNRQQIHSQDLKYQEIVDRFDKHLNQTPDRKRRPQAGGTNFLENSAESFSNRKIRTMNLTQELRGIREHPKFLTYLLKQKPSDNKSLNLSRTQSNYSTPKTKLNKR